MMTNKSINPKKRAITGVFVPNQCQEMIMKVIKHQTPTGGSVFFAQKQRLKCINPQDSIERPINMNQPTATEVKNAQPRAGVLMGGNMMKPPERDEKRESFLKARKLGKYSPDFKPFIPERYIRSCEGVKL